MAQNFPGALIRPTLQSGLRKLEVEKSRDFLIFRSLIYTFFSFLKFDPYFALILYPILVDAKHERITSNFTFEKMRKKVPTPILFISG